ncbi:MAG: hypothetical protein IH905_01580 [Proteobacteria bacterium]|nr:hypothetical protein [Pseudomonadota bacterium]
MTLIGSESSVVGSGEVALWRAVLEQAMNDACLLRFNPGVNRNPTPASRERDRLRTTASDWFKSGGQDFSLVCDWADLPAEASNPEGPKPSYLTQRLLHILVMDAGFFP